jgi:hypothetical protein
MSHIEAVTKPVLLPLVMSRTDKRTLNTEELGILARWMTLRSMVSDGLFEEHYFTETDRRAFAVENSSPPPNTHSWLVPSDPALNIAYLGGSSYADRINGQHLLTVVANHVALQIATMLNSPLTCIRNRRLDSQRCITYLAS